MKRRQFLWLVGAVIIFCFGCFLGKAGLYFSEEVVYQKREPLRYSYANKFRIEPIQVFLSERNRDVSDNVVLQFSNKSIKPVEIVAVRIDDVVLEPIDGKLVLPVSVTDNPTFFTEAAFKLPEGVSYNLYQLDLITVESRIMGTEVIHQQFVHPWALYDPGFPDQDFLTKAPNFRDVSFLKVRGKRIDILSGDWELAQPLHIPQGFTVWGGAGSSINLRNGAFILSYSPLKIQGEPSKPFRIYSSDGTGQGLVVLEAETTSQFSYVEFERLGQVTQGLWSQTAAVTFYESDVDFSYCVFRDNHGGDDMLNIFRADSFRIEGSLFESIESDAVDSDFSDGIVIDTVFRDIGNDGIDVSGSQIMVQDVYLDGIGDKAISAGEKSEMTLDNITITDAEIGVTSKDLSVLNGQDVVIDNTRLGIAVFQKKEEYGPAIASLKADLRDVDTAYLLEKKSSLTLNGKLIKKKIKHVKDKLYGKDFGKASR